MGQNVLTKQSVSRLVSAHVWTSLMIFISNSRTNLARAQTVDTRPFSFPPREKGLGTRLPKHHAGFTSAGTHDVQNTTYQDEPVAVTIDYIENTEALGALLALMYLDQDGNIVCNQSI